MTIDEAIKHCEEVAKFTRGHLVELPKLPDKEQEECIKCAEEHEQLAEWLKDYKRLLDWEKDIKGKVYRNEYCDRAGKCIDYIGWHCTGCNRAEENS